MAADETLQIRFQSQIWPGLRTQVLAFLFFTILLVTDIIQA